MKGRKPKPTALKLLQGNAGKRRIDTREEITVPGGPPTAPDYLSAGARAEWVRMMSHLSSINGLLTPIDAAAVGIYCSYYDQWQQAEAEIPIRREQLEKITGSEDTADYGRTLNFLNMALGERNKARKEVRAYLSELGLTPSARARLRLPDGQDQTPTEGNALEVSRNAFSA